MRTLLVEQGHFTDQALKDDHDEIHIARPAVSEKRLSLTAQGKMRYGLKTPYRDGTTHVIFEPLDFIAKLAALVPIEKILTHLYEKSASVGTGLLPASRAPPQAGFFD